MAILGERERDLMTSRVVCIVVWRKTSIEAMVGEYGLKLTNL